MTLPGRDTELFNQENADMAKDMREAILAPPTAEAVLGALVECRDHIIAIEQAWGSADLVPSMHRAEAFVYGEVNEMVARAGVPDECRCGGDLEGLSCGQCGRPYPRDDEPVARTLEQVAELDALARPSAHLVPPPPSAEAVDRLMIYPTALALLRRVDDCYVVWEGAAGRVDLDDALQTAHEFLLEVSDE
jgi:hypothetical protein